MAFVAICRAIYDYAPQSEGELAIREGELLYILEKSEDDDWWKAKKNAEGEEEEEPVGLIPNNYVEEAQPTHQARALFEYSRQTEEELSFAEDDILQVFDTSDGDWTLVGLQGEFGFVPANYIEVLGDEQDDAAERGEENDDDGHEADIASPPLPSRPPVQPSSAEAASTENGASDPAANIASIMGGNAARTPIAPPRPAAVQTPPEEDDEEEEAPPPPMPRRPSTAQQEAASPPLPTRELSPPSPVVPPPAVNRASRSASESGGQGRQGGYHLYNINEMVAVLGKMKKMPTTLGINLGLGVILVMPEKKRDGPQQEWTAEKMAHYSIEGKHVFVDLVKPSKSFDFHAGAKETAMEIVSMLGELAGAARAEGLREVFAASSGSQKKGLMLYDFMAQGDDEVTVADGDEVIILDDSLSEDWWKVRRIKNGKEGVVPSSYVEVTGPASPNPPQADPSIAAIQSGMSNVERNRREEERLTREAIAAAEAAQPPEPQPNKRSSRSDGRSGAKSRPDAGKVRMFTDRSGTFKVEAQFIGLRDGKVHLHKVNGVKIAVPLTKMSKVDIEYVERMTGKSLDDEKPLADVRRGVNGSRSGSAAAGPTKPEYDWFDFFLKCGVSPYQCERYSYNFHKDSMDEGVLSDINPTVLRNLGLKEGDILRVMKYLDNQFGRSGDKGDKPHVSFGPDEVANENGEDGQGGLFAGPGGALRNNRGKGRPAPAVATNDNIDSKMLEHGVQGAEPFPKPRERPTSESKPPPPPPKDNVGFEDNAWDVKPAQQPLRPQQPVRQASRAETATPPVKAASPPPAAPPPALTGGMAELSLLTQPLQPTKLTQQPPLEPQPPIIPVQPAPVQQQRQTSPVNQQQGANPSFFTQLNPQQTGLPQLQQQQQQQQQPLQSIGPQPTGQFQFNPPRQRPQAPPTGQQGALMPPPPVRPMSAPQNQSNSSMLPLQAQHTGYITSSSPPPNLNQLQQLNALQPQFTGFVPQSQGFNAQQQQQQFPAHQLQPQMTAFQPQSQFGMNGHGFGNSTLLPQATGYQSTGMSFQSGPSGLLPQPTGSINSMLPPALQPQSTGAVNGFAGGAGTRPGFGQAHPPMPSLPLQYQGQQGPISQQQQQQSQQQQQPPQPPSIPHQPSIAPLLPQKTGPAPDVKFGVQAGAKKLAPQPTGRKANLAQATPDNPFGF